MAIANTVTLSTNFNVDPYYDDFNESKNFHRVLFRPGLAVQARELTQMQTILQNQVDRFAEHIFQEGSTVRGLEMTYDREIKYVKVRDDDQNGDAVDASAFIGSTITGGTSGVKAYVIDALTGSESGTPNTKTLYVRYTGSGTLGTTAAFLSGEVLTSNTSLSANVITEGVQSSNVTGTGSRISFGTGVIFAKDHFIRVNTANTIVGRYSANTNIRVGYTINETIVSSASDTTLLDPAQGAYNYAAPGADRLKLTATITKKELTAEDDVNFVERVRIRDGNIEYKADKPLYSVINEYIAQRTYDESGDYIVNGLNIRIREHLNSANNGGVYTSGNGGDTNKLSADVSPGKAYIRGYNAENLTTKHIEIDKGTDINSVEQISIPANYGNYTLVNEMVGNWDINGHDRVDLYNTAVNAISNNSFTTILPSAIGTKIGEARVRAVEYNSGAKGSAAGQMKLYLYDINMTANSFNYVRSIYYNDATADGIADTVIVGGNAVISETAFNRALFNIPAENIKTLRDTGGSINNEFRFIKEHSVQFASDGTVTVTTGAADEQYPFSTGLLNDTQERENFLVVLRASANSATALQTTAAKATGANTITGLTNATTKYNVGDVIKLQGIANTFVISEVLGATSVKVHGTGTSSGTASNATLFKAFQTGQIISLNGYGGDNAARSVNINSTTSATIDIKETLNSTLNAYVVTELKKVDGQEIAKIINKNRYVEINVSDSGTTAGPWNLGLSDGHKLREVRLKTGNSFFTTTTQGTDVTSDFELDTGMFDTHYDHAKLKLKSTSSRVVANGDIYLVKFDYFTHDTSSGIGYLSVNSYPIDDANTANTTAIQTAEIPVFTSAVTGTRYDLRNQIDIRPRITDTANNVTTLTNISRNPATSTVIVEPSGGLRYMAPNEDFITDFDYYLPRKDRIVVTSTGQFRAIRGVPNLNPQIPPAPSDGMTIGIVNVKPYPSMPQDNARRISIATAPNGRNDLSIKTDAVRVRRFTMKDIQGLEQRIDNLEYYTSLSLLEADTKSLFLADTTGVDRFKNGIAVDQFVDFVSSDYYDAGYKVAIDKENKELRPSFKLDDVQLEFKSANSTNITATSKDATLTISTAGTYTQGETVTQGAASGTLDHQVGTKLYLSNVSGTFTTGVNAVGGTSTTSRNVSSVSVPNAGDLILLPWTHSETVKQEFATDTRNVAGLFYNYRGIVTLTPDNDYWQDVTTAPSVSIDFGYLADAIEEVANHVGITWGSWDTVSTWQQGVTGGIGTFASQTRTGQQLVVNAGTLTETNLGDSVQNVNLIPYVRSRVINFTAQGMKPSTRVYAFFDTHDVNAYVAPANSSFANTASEGSALITDANGVLYGNFRIPNNDSVKFPVGNLKFRLTDSPTNSSSIGSTATSAETNYGAGGLDVVMRGNIISTREIDVSTRTLVENQTALLGIEAAEPVDVGGQGGDDPLAQTFRVSDGISSAIPGAFLSKIDLFFASKDATQPVIIEIRECDASTLSITPKVVPFSRVIVPAADINISTDGSSPTPIIFETPVYLKNNVDYALVILSGGNNPNVTLWTARIGENDLVTGNRVTSQPAVGVLMVSSNDRYWSAVQEEDLKFTLYFANFGTNQTGTAVFKNIDKEYLTIDTKDSSNLFNRANETVHGETSMTLSGALGGAVVNDTVVGASSSANGVVTYVSGSSIRVKEVTTANKFTTTETITLYKAGIAGSNTATLNSQSTPTGKVYFFDSTTQANTYLHLSEPSGTFTANTWVRGQISGLDARIASVDNLNIDTFKVFVSKLELQDTTASTTAKLALTGSSLDSAFRNVNINSDTEYDSRRYVLSRSNEVANLSSKKSAEFRVAMTNGANPRHSPAIDNQRAAMFTVENLVNNDSTDEDTAGNGNAIARYVQKTITLAEGQDAEDLKVFISAYKPSTADIKIYVKLLNGEDGETMDDKTWLELSQITSTTVVSDSENTQDFKEFEYNIPTANLTGGSGEVQYTDNGVTYTGFKHFKIKVVLLSTTPSRVPRIKDFRAIALQI